MNVANCNLNYEFTHAIFSTFGNANINIKELGQLWAYLNAWKITGTIVDNKEQRKVNNCGLYFPAFICPT